MIGLVALCALVSAPAIDVSVAPDQPIPYVYADEPVILQFRSTHDGKAGGQVTILGDDGKSVTIPLPELPLRANGAHWQQLEGAPGANGRYRVHVALDAQGVKVETDLVYCRIQRPNDGVSGMLQVAMPHNDAQLLHALRGVPVHRVTLPQSVPDLAAVLGSAAEAGFSVTVHCTDLSSDASAALAALASAAGDKIAAWRFASPEGGMTALDTVVAGLRQAGSRAPVEVLINDGTDVPGLFAAGLGRTASALVANISKPDDGKPALLRAAAERAGYESLPVRSAFGAGAAANGTALVQQALNAFECGAGAEFEIGSLYRDGAFEEAYPLLSAIAHRLTNLQCVGDYPVPVPMRAKVFRHLDNWTVAVWTGGEPATLPLVVGEAAELALYDAWNNRLETPALEDGTISLSIAASPTYVVGSGGSVLPLTARNMARREADLFVKNKMFQRELPSELIDMMKSVAAPGLAKVDRVTFFALLRMFPVLEQKWHDGTLRRDAAAPALAALGRLLRHLCVLEQDSGEPFIELLQETVARSGEYQSQYLTSTGGSAEKHERADWLLSEVARLTAEAKTLAENNRSIEAVGVASIAEWRARCLQFALNAAPLGSPEPPRVEPAEKPKTAPKSNITVQPKKKPTKKK